MRRFIFLAILLTASLISLYGNPLIPNTEEPRYTYNLLTPADGYPSSPTTLFINNFGIGWAGSSRGLYRLEPNGATKVQLPGFPINTNIYQILEDAEYNIWTLTEDGINGARPKEKVFEPEVIKGVPDTAIAYAAAYTPSEIFFGGDNAIWKYTYLSGEFSFVTKLNVTGSAKVDKMFLGLRGTILIFCNGFRDLYFLYPATGTVSKVDLEKLGLVGNYYAAFVDSEYKLWLASYNEGIIKVDSSGGILATYNASNSPISNDLVTCFAECSKKLWIGTDGGGINIIDLKSGEVNVLRQKPYDPRSLPANTISSLAVSSKGNIWAGRKNGGIIYISESEVNSYRTSEIRPFITAEGIQSLYNDGTSKSVWIGTTGTGLLSLNPETNLFTGYPTTAGFSIYLMTDYDETTLLLYCKAKGLTYFNKVTKEVTPASNLAFLQTYAKNGGIVSTLCNDADGNVLIAADSLYCINPKNGDITATAIREAGQTEEVYGSIGKYYHDETTIYRRSEASGDELVPLFTSDPEEQIYSASVGNHYDIWFVSSKGLSQFDIAADSVARIPVTISHTPHSVICDGNGNVWVGTGSELYCYNQYQETHVMLDESENVFGNDYRNSAKCLNSSGDIFMGGVDGLVHLGRELSFNIDEEPSIVLQGVKLDSKQLSDFTNLVIPNNFNDLFLRFIVRDDDILRQKPCKFTVMGPFNIFEEETDLPQISFHGLKAGKYVVYASCKTKDGRWTAPSEALSFKVRTPWFLSPWFFCLVLSVMIAIFLGISYAIRSKQNHLLENEANEERLNFLVNVSHEIRTPLTLVIGPLGRILREMPEDDKYHEVIKRVFSQANRMKMLLNTILTTSRIRAGVSDMNRRNVNLNDWIQLSIEAFRGETSNRNMDLVLQLDPSINMVYFDDNMCLIVLSNFMMNALKHNPDGRPLIIKSEKCTERSSVRVSVTDKGLGFGNIDPEKLFARFYRADQDMSGFGVGLSYAKSIIVEHRGAIGAYNNPDGEGATFWFELPVEEKSVNIDNATAVKGNQGLQGFADVRGIMSLKDLNVLFVDDEKDLRVYFEEEFEDSFAKVICAENGFAALAKLSSEKIDLVITDIMMPEIDGMELCRRIKQNPKTKDIPVMMLTAKADIASREMGMRSGADSYIAKPFGTGALLISIRKIFNLE